MKFDTPLTRGRLVKRYKRFLADVELENGEIVVAHCANSGSMMGLKDEGNPVWLSPNQNPKAKLDWRWEVVEVEGALVGINTSRPNAIVEEAILAGRVPELSNYETLRREVKYGTNSRIDILLENPDSDTAPSLCYVEVKNVTLKRHNHAEFPDAVTVRGAKHLGELADMVKAGHRAVMFYLVNRNDCTAFRLASDIDPAYATAFDEAIKAGVEVLVYRADLSAEAIEVGPKISCF